MPKLSLTKNSLPTYCMYMYFLPLLPIPISGRSSETNAYSKKLSVKLVCPALEMDSHVTCTRNFHMVPTSTPGMGPKWFFGTMVHSVVRPTVAIPCQQPDTPVNKQQQQYLELLVVIAMAVTVTKNTTQKHWNIRIHLDLVLSYWIESAVQNACIYFYTDMTITEWVHTGIE